MNFIGASASDQIIGYIFFIQYGQSSHGVFRFVVQEGEWVYDTSEFGQYIILRGKLNQICI